MEPLVSVYCFAYNHEKYIRDALEGFVCQKTSFPYEVIIHDDASTDHTQVIIREYAAKYPDIIKPIYQTENQYSQHISIFRNYIYPRLKGKYIAVCEGDDYWIDKNKLQLQVEWLENHPDYSFCVHNTKMINCLNGKERLINANSNDRDIATEEIIQWKGNLFHTSSFMYRAEYAIIPSAFSIKGVGDYPRSVYLATCGKVRYIGRVMSVYRFLSSGSWSMKMYHSADSISKNIEHWRDRITMLNNVDEYTKGRYTDCIHDTIRRNEFNILYNQNDLKIIQQKYKDYFNRLSIKEKTRLELGYYCPALLKIYRAIRK